MDNQYAVLTAPPPVLAQQSPFDLTDLITEDDEPVDNFLSAKQQRLLVEPLYSSAKLKRPFLADSDVAIYGAPRSQAIVPDMFLSLGVQVADEWWEKENRSYLLSEFGKAPEVALEIVSNEKGNEDGSKLDDYAALSILYYVIYDPQQLLSNAIVRVYQLVAGEYMLRPDYRLPAVELSLIFWYGAFEDKPALWLRWADPTGDLILTGAERADQERQRAEHERQRAEQERQRAEDANARAADERQRAEEADARAAEERQRAEEANARAAQTQQRADRLAAQLRALGIEPESGA